jgi:hypothetical protein
LLERCRVNRYSIVGFCGRIGRPALPGAASASNERRVAAAQKIVAENYLSKAHNQSMNQDHSHGFLLTTVH